jgi:hypothetical protein
MSMSGINRHFQGGSAETRHQVGFAATKAAIIPALEQGGPA